MDSESLLTVNNKLLLSFTKFIPMTGTKKIGKKDLLKVIDETTVTTQPHKKITDFIFVF